MGGSRNYATFFGGNDEESLDSGSIEQIGVSGNVVFPCLSPFFCVNAVMWKILRYSEQPWDLELFPKLSDKSSCTIFPCTTRRRWHVPCGPGKRPRRGPEVVGGDAVHGTEWLTSWNAIKIGDWVKLQPWAFQPFFKDSQFESGQRCAVRTARWRILRFKNWRFRCPTAGPKEWRNVRTGWNAVHEILLVRIKLEVS